MIGTRSVLVPVWGHWNALLHVFRSVFFKPQKVPIVLLEFFLYYKYRNWVLYTDPIRWSHIQWQNQQRSIKHEGLEIRPFFRQIVFLSLSNPWVICFSFWGNLGLLKKLLWFFRQSLEFSHQILGFSYKIPWCPLKNTFKVILTHI